MDNRRKDISEYVKERYTDFMLNLVLVEEFAFIVIILFSCTQTITAIITKCVVALLSFFIINLICRKAVVAYYEKKEKRIKK